MSPKGPTNVTLVSPAALASRRPYSRKPSQQSTASTEPVGPTKRASSIAVSPKPQPASTTLSASWQTSRLNEHLEHDCGLTVFQHACKMKLEGIVAIRSG